VSEEALVTSGKTGGAWNDIFGSGLSAIAEAGKAVAVAVETQQLAVDPHLVDAMIKKLTKMQDDLQEVARNSQSLSMNTKLGGGYAEQISESNRTFGTGAVQTLTEMAKALEALKTQIEKSRASYQNVDQTHADSLKKLDGKS
jgi:uncharacterized protein YukE